MSRGSFNDKEGDDTLGLNRQLSSIKDNLHDDLEQINEEGVNLSQLEDMEASFEYPVGEEF